MIRSAFSQIWHSHEESLHLYDEMLNFYNEPNIHFWCFGIKILVSALQCFIFLCLTTQLAAVIEIVGCALPT
jgi:F0F1-type ATP synthase membrane subunit a